MSLQVHAWRSVTNFNASATSYISPINGQAFTATELLGSCYVTAAGTFSKWQIVLPSAPTAGKSVTFTLLINGVDTAAAITIADANTVGTWTGTPIALADGNKITFRSVPSSNPTASTPIMSWSFNSTVAGESIYGSGGVNGLITTTRTNNLLFRQDATNFQALGLEVVACPGIISKITIELSADTGATGTWTFTVNKNGVAQDGAGGTPDTRIVFDNTGTVKSATFSLPVAAGDYFTWTCTESGTPTSTRVINGVKFTATVPGESHFGGVSLSLSNTNTVYLPCGNGSNAALPTVEATGQINVGLTPFKLKNLYCLVQLGVGAGADVGYAFNLKKAGAATALTASILNNATAANDQTGVANFGSQDILGLEVIPANTPTARFPSWAAIQFQSGGGSSNSGKKGGGGGLNIQAAGGCSMIQMGNPSLDIGATY